MAYNYYGYDNRGGGFLGSIPPVTKNIILINIIIYIATLVNQEFMIEKFAMFYPASPYFRFWQPITYMFMHGGFWHIFFNMYALLIFGLVLERSLGSKKFLVFYFLTGLGALAVHTGVQYIQMLQYAKHVAGTGLASVAYQRLLGIPTVGASGAVYGVLIGYAMLYPDSILTLIFPPISLKAKWFVVIFAVIELTTGVFGTMEGIAHFAHLGGMLFGWLLILWWKYNRRLYDRDKWI